MDLLHPILFLSYIKKKKKVTTSAVFSFEAMLPLVLPSSSPHPWSALSAAAHAGTVPPPSRLPAPRLISHFADDKSPEKKEKHSSL